MQTNRSATLASMVMVMAASAFGQGNTLYVNRHNPTPPDPYIGFGDWASAATNIQDAVDAAASGDTILVAPGTYTLPPEAGAVVSITGNKIASGGSLTLRAALPPGGAPGVPVIDGQGVNRGIRVEPDELRNAARTFTLDGFHVVNGFTTGSGAGILFGTDESTRYLSAFILNTVISNNSARTSGAGIRWRNVSGTWPSALTLSNSVVAANTLRNDSGTANRQGAGIYTRFTGDLTLIDTIVEGNVIEDGESTGLAGGGIYVHNGSIEAINSIFRNNQVGLTASGANTGGGAIFGNDPERVSLLNSLFTGNTANNYSVFHHDASGTGEKTLSIVNSTIAGNWGEDSSRGPINIRRAGGSLTVYNTIFADNGASDRSITGSTGLNPYEVRFSRIAPADTVRFPDPSNITAPPLFIGNGDYRLQSGSPCINTGTNLIGLGETRDLAGNRRIDPVFNQVDMGAFEYQFAGTTILVQ